MFSLGSVEAAGSLAARTRTGMTPTSRFNAVASSIRTKSEGSVQPVLFPSICRRFSATRAAQPSRCCSIALTKTGAGWNLTSIERCPAGKGSLQPVVQATRIARGVLTAIADEDVALHGTDLLADGNLRTHGMAKARIWKATSSSRDAEFVPGYSRHNRIKCGLPHGNCCSHQSALD